MKYVTLAAYQGYGYPETSVTADTWIEQEKYPVFTGLLDSRGEKLYRYPEKISMGFQGKPK